MSEQYRVELADGLCRVKGLPGCSQGKEIAVDETTACVTGQLRAERDQTTLMPLDDGFQRLGHDQRAHRRVDCTPRSINTTPTMRLVTVTQPTPLQRYPWYAGRLPLCRGQQGSIQSESVVETASEEFCIQSNTFGYIVSMSKREAKVQTRITTDLRLRL